MKEIKKEGKIKSQAGLPYDPTICEKNRENIPFTFVHTKEDLKYKKHFADEEQWETFIQLPLNEAQRNKLMSKLQADFAKKKQMVKEEEKKTSPTYAEVVKKNITSK